MKLNNHGWSMRDMIIYTCILVLFLLFVSYSIRSLYSAIDTSKENYEKQQDVYQPPVEEEKEEQPIVDLEYYENVELKLKNATLQYLDTYPTDLTNNILKVSSGTLINLGFIDKIYDQTGSSTCTGYSNVYQDTEEEYVIKSYVSCVNYVTEGY